MRLAWLALVWIVPAPLAPASPAPCALEELAQLEAAWRAALAEWEEADARARAEGKRRNERAPHPAAAWWPRFEAAADAGEGRAVVWMLAHTGELRGAVSAQKQRAAALLARVEAADGAPWVAEALPHLAALERRLDAERLAALLDALGAPERPRELRLAVLATRAELADRSASKLELLAQARALRLEGPPLAERSKAELDALARHARLELEVAEQASWEEHAAREDAGGFRSYTPDAGVVALLWQLADAGGADARVWALCNPSFLSRDQQEALPLWFEACAREPLSGELLSELTRELRSLMRRFGPTLVAERMTTLFEAAEEPLRPGLFFKLGEALCREGRADEALRERGLALLRGVLERWPETPSTERIQGKLFRFEHLVVGKQAPDFESVDVDGNALRLSDYDGKVVVLDFWGFW